MNSFPIIEVMDTTLRDGEQTSGVSFTASEKLQIAKQLLLELKVDRIEVASARVSKGEMEGVQKITSWAKENGFLDKVEVLGFVDKGASIAWMEQAGAKVINLLTKGSLNHLKYQLKKTPEEHFSEIEQTFKLAREKGFGINIYLEDWSNGMKDSPEYVFQFLDFLSTQDIDRVMLPDTLGVLIPSETRDFISQCVEKYPSLHFDFHAHNDYDVSVANVMEAVEKGARGIHTTVNGLGERAGNAPLASIVAVLNDFTDFRLNVEETKIYSVSKLIEQFSGLRIPANKPVVGANVFTQTAGIHADGDSKKNLYFNDLMPERFGRKRKYALGKTSGRANIQKNLEELGISLEKEDLQIVTNRIIELGDQKEMVTTEDLPYIIADVLHNKSIDNKIQIEAYSMTHAKGLAPVAQIRLNVDGESYEATSTGDGQYDAFVKALKEIYQTLNKPFPKLADYQTTIPPGGKTDALVETTITWEMGKKFKTRGLDGDQTVSALKATEKMLNLIEELGIVSA